MDKAVARREQIVSIQVLRGIFCMIVAFYHCSLIGSAPSNLGVAAFESLVEPAGSY